MRDEILSLVKRISGQENMLVLPRLFIDLTGDIHSALLLSQLLYWSDRTCDRDGWIYKTHKDWQAELGLNRYFLDKSRSRLTELGLIAVKVKRANGSPTMHFKVNGDQLGKSLNMVLASPQNGVRQWNCETVADGNARLSQKEMSKSGKSLTETTTETTTSDDAAHPYQSELFCILERIPAFPQSRPVDKLLELEADYPDIDYRLEFKKFAEYWSGRKLKKPWLALRNWMERAGHCQLDGKKRSRALPRKYSQPPGYDD